MNMKRAGEYIDSMRSLAADLEQAARDMAREAAHGFAPADDALSELKRMGGEQARLREELCALLTAQLGDGRDYAALPLDGLAQAAEECERALRECEAICERISGAAELMERLGAPSCGGESVAGLAARAREALEAGELDELRALERQAQPYLDLEALLRDDAEAMRGDAALIGRVERAYPQIAWFMRARARMERDAGAFDDLSDEAVDGLRRTRTDEGAAQQECRSGRRRPAASRPRRAAAQPREHAGAPEAASSGAGDGDDDGAGPAGRANGPRGPLADAQRKGAAVTASRAEPLLMLDGAARGNRLRHVEQRLPACRAFARTGEAERVRAQAAGVLCRLTPRHPVGAGVRDAVRMRMLAPGAGVVSTALEAICVRDRAGYARVRELCERVLIPGQRRGVLVRGLEELLRGLWREEARRLGTRETPPGADWVLDWLGELMPALHVLGDWRQLAEAGGCASEPWLGEEPVAMLAGS